MFLNILKLPFYTLLFNCNLVKIENRLPSYSSWYLSGGHINPSVTLAMAVIGRFPWHKVPVYMIAQYCGAFCASFFIFIIYLGKRNFYQHFFRNLFRKYMLMNLCRDTIGKCSIVVMKYNITYITRVLNLAKSLFGVNV